jgi:hypothetical protein
MLKTCLGRWDGLPIYFFKVKQMFADWRSSHPCMFSNVGYSLHAEYPAAAW